MNKYKFNSTSNLYKIAFFLIRLIIASLLILVSRIFYVNLICLIHFSFSNKFIISVVWSSKLFNYWNSCYLRVKCNKNPVETKLWTSPHSNTWKKCTKIGKVPSKDLQKNIIAQTIGHCTSTSIWSGRNKLQKNALGTSWTSEKIVF